MALPWASTHNKLVDSSAKFALLVAAKALDPSASQDDDPEETVTNALLRMPAKERERHTAIIKKTQERIHSALAVISEQGGEITKERVLALMREQ